MVATNYSMSTMRQLFSINHLYSSHRACQVGVITPFYRQENRLRQVKQFCQGYTGRGAEIWMQVDLTSKFMFFPQFHSTSGFDHLSYLDFPGS